MDSFLYDLMAESASLRSRLGFEGRSWLRSVPVYIILLFAFGIFLPWQKGSDFLDPVILGAYSCLGVVFAAPTAGASFEDPPSYTRAVGRVVVNVLYGELIALLLVVLGVAMVYASRWGRVFIGVNLVSLVECAAFGAALSLALTSMAVWLTLQFSPTVSRAAVRLWFVALLAAFLLRSRWLPDIALWGALLATMFAAGALGLMKTAVSGQAR